MSDPIKVMNSGNFNNVYDLQEFELLASSGDPQGKPMFALVLRPQGVSDSSLAVTKAEKHEWLRLARHIQRTLDPSPEDQILRSLHRIERLLEQRQQ